MRRVIIAAFVAFLVTRAIFFALTVIGSQIAFERKVYSDSVWETRVVLSGDRFLPELSRVAMTGDAWFYRSIAVDGYTRRPATDAEGANWAFFPLFPLVARLLGADGNFAIIGMLISNAAFLGALILVGAVSVETGFSIEDAERAVWYAAAFPTSYFCSLPLPEALFLLLSSGAFYAAAIRRWPLAGVFGACAAATRFAGILLLPALVLLAYERRDRLRTVVPWLLVVPAGTGAFMLHLYRITGSPFAFMTIQTQWQRKPGAAWQPLIEALANLPVISGPWNFVAFNFIVAIVVIGVGIALLKARRWSFAAYTLGSVLVPLSSGSLQSLGRYAAVIFPLFMYLALRGRNPAVDRTLMAVMLILFGWFVALFVLRVDFALA